MTVHIILYTSQIIGSIYLLPHNSSSLRFPNYPQVGWRPGPQDLEKELAEIEAMTEGKAAGGPIFLALAQRCQKILLTSSTSTIWETTWGKVDQISKVENWHCLQWTNCKFEISKLFFWGLGCKDYDPLVSYSVSSTMASPTGTAGDGSTAPTADNKDYSWYYSCMMLTFSPMRTCVGKIVVCVWFGHVLIVIDRIPGQLRRTLVPPSLQFHTKRFNLQRPTALPMKVPVQRLVRLRWPLTG